MEPSIRMVSASRVNVTSSPEPEATRSPERLERRAARAPGSPRRSPCGRASAAGRPARRWRRRRCSGRSSRRPRPRCGSGSASTSTRLPTITSSARKTTSTASPRGTRRRWRKATNGLSSSAISAATTNSSVTGPAARSSAQAPRIASGRTTSWIQRGTTTGATGGGGGPSGASGASGGAGGSPGRGSSGGSATPPGPGRSCSSCIASSMRRRGEGRLPWAALTAILFVGDVVGSAGRRVARTMLADLRDGARARTSSWSTGRTPRAASASRPSTPTSCSPPGADVITLGNHTYRHREVWPYLRATRRDRPAGELPAVAARARAPPWSSATASRSAWSTWPATSSWATPPRRCWPSTTRCARSPAPTRSWSTCTPRPRARRSRSAGTWTAG